MISASTRISVLVVCLSLRVSYSDTALVRTFDSRVELNAARQGARDTLRYRRVVPARRTFL
jgi:hypothetical protein